MPGSSHRDAMGEGSAISRRQQKDAPQGRLALPQPRGLSPPRAGGDASLEGTCWGKGARELPQTFLIAPCTVPQPHDYFLLPTDSAMANKGLVELLLWSLLPSTLPSCLCCVRALSWWSRPVQRLLLFPTSPNKLFWSLLLPKGPHASHRAHISSSCALDPGGGGPRNQDRAPSSSTVPGALPLGLGDVCSLCQEVLPRPS